MPRFGLSYFGVRDPRHVRTIHRFGYAFCGPAETEASEGPSEPLAPTSRFALIPGEREVPPREGENLLGRVPDDDVGPEGRFMQKQAVASLAAHEEDLPPRQREIFRLRFYAEMELEEIATALDVHVGTVKTQLHRAVHRLREELGAYR